jgi:mono/diheme cytochrome c family protein
MEGNMRHSRKPDAAAGLVESEDRSSRYRIMAVWHVIAFSLLALTTLGGSLPARAAEPELVIADGTTEHHFKAAGLLARPDCISLKVKGDGDIYHGTVTYRAVPLAKLLGDNTDRRFDAIETRARDGFVAQIPLDLIMRGKIEGGNAAVAWVAIEDPANPWPPLPNQSETAGPFYLIWEHAERSGVVREQWPYQMVQISYVETPVKRWPQLAAPKNLPVNSLARHGQDVFTANCLPCHRLNGGGASDTGPDLGRPMNPTQYLTDAGLRAIIRNPKAVRTWPEQHMEGFDKEVLPDSDLDAVVAYLHAMAQPKP